MAERRSVVLDEIVRFGASLPLARLDEVCEAIGAAERVYLHGVGRSGLVLRLLAVRLTHLALPCHVVGEATTPAIGPRDLLIAASGSGTTPGVVAIAARARAAGATVVALTAHGEATVAGAATHVIVLPGVAKSDDPAAIGSRQPPGSLFEQMLMLFVEELTLRLAGIWQLSYDAMARRHANLE
jgi:6-phospho-3-hexuloisomerase